MKLLDSFNLSNELLSILIKILIDFLVKCETSLDFLAYKYKDLDILNLAAGIIKSIEDPLQYKEFYPKAMKLAGIKHSSVSRLTRDSLIGISIDYDNSELSNLVKDFVNKFSIKKTNIGCCRYIKLLCNRGQVDAVSRCILFNSVYDITSYPKVNDSVKDKIKSGAFKSSNLFEDWEAIIPYKNDIIVESDFKKSNVFIENNTPYVSCKVVACYELHTNALPFENNAPNSERVSYHVKASDTSYLLLLDDGSAITLRSCNSEITPAIGPFLFNILYSNPYYMINYIKRQRIESSQDYEYRKQTTN